MSVALNTSINSLVNPKLARSIFKEQLPNIEAIRSWYDGICRGQDGEYREMNLLCTQTIDNGYRIILADNLPIPFVFKYKGQFIKSLDKYEDKHIQFSVIKTVLLDGDGDIESRINRAIYILYNYWFFHKQSINDITHNVCVDLENIIANLINKGLSTYREYIITNDLVEAIRDKLASERLMNLGDV